MARDTERRGYIEKRVGKRGVSWRVTVKYEGLVRRVTVRHPDKRAAKVRLKQELKALEAAHARQAAGLPDVVRFSALLDEYERSELPVLAEGTRKAYTDSLKPIRAYFVEQLDDMSVNLIRAAHIDAYMDWRRTARGQGKRRKDNTDERPLAPRTLNKDRRLLHRLFVVAERREYRDGNPVARTEPRKTDDFEPVILDADQYERLLVKCAEHSPMLGLYALLLGETGIRSKSEGLHLHWSDVDFKTGFITVKSGREGHRTKSGKSRVVPMTSRLAGTLRDYYAANRLGAASPYIFAHTGAERRGERIASLRFAFLNAAEAAEVPAGFRVHDLRHRRVTTWLAAGKSPVAVQHAMGHSDIKTTMAYYSFLPEHLRTLTEEGPAAPVAASGGA